MLEFKVPDIGEGISEAEILAWHVRVGDVVAEGDIVAEISTDKANVELPSPARGRIVELRGAPGDVVPVGTVLMVIEPASQTAGSRPEPAVAAPAVRRLASALGLALDQVRGSGPGGRVLQRDVEQAAAARAAHTALPAVSRPAADLVGTERLSGVRAQAAERLARSTRTAVSSTTTFLVGAERLHALGRELEAEAGRRGVKVTPLALVAKCTAAALRAQPRFNAVIDEAAGTMLMHRAVDLGFAVATPRGLLVPVVRDVAAKSVLDVAAALAELVERAREGRLRFEDTAGGTFTISSTGGLDRSRIVSTQPIINPPQVATMWVSKIGYAPWADAGGVTAKRSMTCSLSFDHRYVDGGEASAFINELTERLEQPDTSVA